MTDTSKLDALRKQIRLEIYTFEDDMVSDDDFINQVIELCQPYYAQLAKDAVNEFLLPRFVSRASEAIDKAFNNDIK